MGSNVLGRCCLGKGRKFAVEPWKDLPFSFGDVFRRYHSLFYQDIACLFLLPFHGYKNLLIAG
jgi:hypothetical protein